MFHMAKIRFICHLLNPQENKLSRHLLNPQENKLNPEPLSRMFMLGEPKKKR